MKKLVILLACLLMASNAFAVTDTDPDGIGIYFDMTADTNITEADVYTYVDAYLMISNPSVEWLGGWECSLEFNPGAFNAAYVYPRVGLNVFTEPEFAVGLAEPFLMTNPTLLVTLECFMMLEEGTLFTVEGSPVPSLPSGLPAYVDGEDLSNIIELQNSTGYTGRSINPCAAINMDLQYTAVEAETWGGVKSLFR